MAGEHDRRRFYTRVSLVLGTSTIILTLAFIGVLSIVSGEATNPIDRLPWYLVISALAFAGTIVLLEGYGAGGREIIVTATVVTLWSFLIVALSVEGVIFTINHPEEVFITQLVLYFIAAALLGTGIAYWALHHWREFTGRAPARL